MSKARPNQTHTTDRTNSASQSSPSRPSAAARVLTASTQPVPPEFGKREKEAEKMLEGLANG
jgi:hypothetical protein